MTADRKNMTPGCRTAGAVAVRALMDYAVSKGGTIKVLADRSGIDLRQLRDVENRLSFACYEALMKAAKEMCNDPAFGLHFGESDAGIEATFACMMGIFSPTMTQALEQDDVYDRIRMTRVGDEVWFTETREEDFVEAVEARFARAVCAARRLFPGLEFVKAVHFTHPEPAYRAEYDRIFRVPVTFGSQQNGLLTDSAWLQQQSRSASSQAFGMLEERAETLRRQFEDARSTRGRVEALVTNLLRSGVNVDIVAGKLGVGRHTLFRRLRSEGVTFRRVVDELRHKLAVRYLSERKLAVNETAYLLGFSDPAAFSRAYKRWTGHSPGRSR
jgi:AraC-like DNA-binding protein